MDVFISFVNWVLDAFAEGLTWVCNLLPQSPFASWRTDPPAEINLGYITWLIPFPTMFLHFCSLVLVIGLYYLYRVIARWVKLVRS